MYIRCNIRCKCARACAPEEPEPEAVEDDSSSSSSSTSCFECLILAGFLVGFCLDVVAFSWTAFFLRAAGLGVSTRG